MPELKVTIQCEQDGVELPGFPLIFRQVVTESLPLEVQKLPDNNTTSYSQVPGTIPGTLQVLVLSFDQALNFQFNNDGPLPMGAAGCVVLVGANLGLGASTNVTVNNPAPTGNPNANIVGVAAGAP